MSRRSGLCNCIFSGALVFSAQPAFAERLRLLDGSVLEGTVFQRVPGAPVRVLLTNGGVRDLAEEELLIDTASVARVRFQANSPEVTLFRHSGVRWFSEVVSTPSSGSVASNTYQPGGSSLQVHVDRSYEPICTSPCVAAMPVGRNRLGFGLISGSNVVEHEELLDLHDGQRLVVEYNDRWVTRLAGWFTLFGGPALAGALATPMLEGGERAAGAVTLGAGALTSFVVGLILVTRSDQVEVHLE